MILNAGWADASGGTSSAIRRGGLSEFRMEGKHEIETHILLSAVSKAIITCLLVGSFSGNSL